MASDNETVAEIVSLMRNEGYYRGFMGITNPLTDRMISSLLDRIEAAHKREVDAILKDRDDMYKSEQETVAKTNAWFGEYQTLKREVAELRKFLEEAASLRCHECFHSNHGRCEEPYANCMAKKWRKALEGAKHDSK